MNEKSGFFRKAAKLLTGKGFYMVLLLCLVILGASGFFLFRTMSDLAVTEPANAQAEVSVPTDAQTEVIDPADELIPAVSEEIIKTMDEPEEVAVADPIPEEVHPVSEEPETVAVAEPAEEPAVSVSKPVLGWPVAGEVVSAFSDAELTYNEVLEDWRTHSGVDLAAAVGTEVLSATAGTVERILNDPVTGTTITLSHENGLTTVYGNLDADTLSVSEGELVAAGQILGCVGSGAEQTEPCLHFAILVDGVSVDPEAYIG